MPTYGNGNQTIVEGSNETITVGNGNDNITIGSNDNLTVGNGNDTITAGSSDTITVGNGNDTITAGAHSTSCPSRHRRTSPKFTTEDNPPDGRHQRQLRRGTDCRHTGLNAKNPGLCESAHIPRRRKTLACAWDASAANHRRSRWADGEGNGSARVYTSRSRFCD
jgi:Ca2+-binding RTX toxin-like protein